MNRILTIGIAVLDDIYTLPMPITPGQKHRASGIATTIGGTATNGAYAIARLGGRPGLLARFGDDAVGAQLRTMLEGYGIDTSLSHAMPGFQTSRSTIVVEPNGERSIFNRMDPNAPEDAPWVPRELPAGFEAVLGDVRWENVALRLFDSARTKGKFAVLDGDRAPQEARLVEASTHAVFSAQAIREMTGISHIGEALAHYAKGRTNFIAATDGEHGTFSHWEGRVTHHPAFPVTAVDTLGAGDTWHGAFTFALVEGMPINTAIRFASAAAAIKVTRPGGPLGAPTKAEVLAFLEERA
ncbi:MAG: PfkB family carbohydrate kinase [Beijerinckiaceae bacterium]|jgi:sulfofructose kinase|nr:PfkB family carbohydrate kinase [Beijerinckiaceae bacterium]